MTRLIFERFYTRIIKDGLYVWGNSIPKERVLEFRKEIGNLNVFHNSNNFHTNPVNFFGISVSPS